MEQLTLLITQSIDLWSVTKTTWSGSVVQAVISARPKLKGTRELLCIRAIGRRISARMLAKCKSIAIIKRSCSKATKTTQVMRKPMVMVESKSVLISSTTSDVMSHLIRAICNTSMKASTEEAHQLTSKPLQMLTI